MYIRNGITTEQQEHIRSQVRKRVQEQLQQDIHKWQNEWIEEIIAHFIECCIHIRQQQMEGYKGEVHYITYSLLRTSLLDQHPAYLIQIADEKGVFDLYPIEYEYNGNCIFQYWQLLVDTLISEAMDQGWKISDLELDTIRLEEAEYFHQVIISLLRKALRQAVDRIEYRALERAAQLEIRAGEYLDQNVLMYREDRNLTEQDSIRAWLAKKQPYAYGYRDLHDIVLSAGDYSEMDFRYTTFRSLQIDFCRLSFGVLAGTIWRECTLDKVTLAFSMIHGANFSGCVLRYSVLDHVMGAAGSEELDWEMLGFDNVNFTGTDLTGSSIQQASLYRACFRDSILEHTDCTGTDLREADLSGAVLRHAVLQGVDLSGACLEHCDLTGASLEGANLSGALLTGAIIDQTHFTGALLSPEQLDIRQRQGAIGLEGNSAMGPLGREGRWQ